MILTVNSGSTSVKLAAFSFDRESRDLQCIRRQRHDSAEDDAHALLTAFASSLPDEDVQVISHRIVHGGTRFTRPIVIDDEVVAAVEALEPLAPLHNPPAIRWIKAARRAFAAEIRQIGVFDTAFFATLPPVAASYAIPRSIGSDLGVRRYGFHGIAHESLWRRWCALNPRLDHGGRLISIQLGGGCSIAAIAQGRPVDVSMGFSPLEGLVMATRSGDIDPAVIPYLQDRLGISSQEVVSRLNHRCGLLGLAGTANLGELFEDSSADARFAIDLYCYRLRKYIGAFCAVLGGWDGVVWGGGVGEHVPEVRKRCLEGMEWCGIRIDRAANDSATSGERCISEEGALGIWVLETDEETPLARVAVNLTDSADLAFNSAVP